MDHLQHGAKLRVWLVPRPEKSPLPITFIYVVRALQKNNPHTLWVFSTQPISDLIYLLFSSHIIFLLKSGASRERETTRQLVEIETAEQRPSSCGGLAASSG